jgi:hypothetical protein
MSKQFSPGDTVVTLDSSLHSNTSQTGSWLDIGPYASAFITISWSGHDANDAAAVLQISRTGATGTEEDYPGSAFTLAAAAGEHTWILNEAGSIPYIAIKYSAGTVSLATALYSVYVRVEVPA